MNIENDIRFADWRRPEDFFEPLDDNPVSIERHTLFLLTLAWVLTGNGLVEVGRRCTVFFYRYRPDLFADPSPSIVAASLGLAHPGFTALVADLEKTVQAGASAAPDLGSVADWLAEVTTLRDRGVRCEVAGYCTKLGPTEMTQVALRGFGRRLGISGQGVNKHVLAFKETFLS